ncbi:unnamed protein product [Brassica napus]|uniref:(rape) hypothetical protein n=1 Tax=Brassica napus TaxID=3708 RepID=A0A816N6N7_BRANA|nr:unnamed protein product [Brassica napus]
MLFYGHHHPPHLLLIFFILIQFHHILHPYSPSRISNSLLVPVMRLGSGQQPDEKTELKHIVFGIAASSSLWKRRSEYVKTWWRPNGEMKGFVWLDKPVNDTVSSFPPGPSLRSKSLRTRRVLSTVIVAVTGQP